MTVPVTAGVERLGLRRGPTRWVRAFALELRWELLSMRLMLPLLAMVQSVVGAGSVLAVSLWFDEVPGPVGLFVTTGGATLALLMVGLVMGPQLVAEQRARGSYDFRFSLPAPRSASTAAWVVLNLVVTIPPLGLTLVLGSWFYDLSLEVAPALLPAVLLTVGTGTMLGYALAHAVRSPTAVQLASQVLVFVIFGFSPILFPGRNLPGWLEGVHSWLPFESMATVVRAGVTVGLVGDVARSYLVIVVWAGLSLGVTALVLGRRT